MPEREFNEIFSYRLKQFLASYNMTQADLAKRLGVGTTTVSDWVNGRKSPRMSKVDAMCEIFNCKRSDFIEDKSSLTARPTTYPLTPSEYTHITKYRQLEPYSKDTVDYIIDRELERLDSTHSVEEPPTEYNDNTKIIPFYPQLVSAGTGQYVFDDIPTETIAVDNKKFRRATYAIRVRGDSMYPTFSDNDVIVVDREAVPDLNEIGIFIINNQGYVKRVGDKALISDNKAYAPIEADDIVCMGKVLGKV